MPNIAIEEVARCMVIVVTCQQWQNGEVTKSRTWTQACHGTHDMPSLDIPIYRNLVNKGSFGQMLTILNF